MFALFLETFAYSEGLGFLFEVTKNFVRTSLNSLWLNVGLGALGRACETNYSPIVFLSATWLPHGQLWASVEEAALLTRC